MLITSRRKEQKACFFHLFESEYIYIKKKMSILNLPFFHTPIKSSCIMLAHDTYKHTTSCCLALCG